MRRMSSSSQATELLEAKRRHRVWLRGVSILACIVVFCTVYALILPAITLEKTEEDAQENRVLTCTAENLNIHSHTDVCYDEQGELICGYDETEIHTHTEECYNQQRELSSSEMQVTEPVDSEEYLQPVEVETVEETPGDEPDSTEGEREFLTAPYGAVISAYAVVVQKEFVEEETIMSPDMEVQDTGSVYASRTDTPVDMADTLTSAEIWVDGEKYDGSTLLDKSKSFSVKLTSEADNNALSYQYRFPEPVVVEDTGSEETPLQLTAGERNIGSYYIKDNTLFVNYEASYTSVVSNFEFAAKWDEDADNKNSIKWNDKLTTPIEFFNEDIMIQKEDGSKGIFQTAEDGGLYIEYTLKANVTGGGNLSVSDKFTDSISKTSVPHVAELYRNAYGNGADYQLTIYTLKEGTEDEYTPGSTEYKKFDSVTEDPDSEKPDNGQAFTIDRITLESNQYAEIKYKVRVSPEYRAKIDMASYWLTVENKATASTQPEGSTEPITSAVTHNAYYSPNKGWINKTAEQPEGGNGENDHWAVTINSNRDYSMEGFALLDNITTGASGYIDDSFTAEITGSGSQQEVSLKSINLTDNNNAAVIITELGSKAAKAQSIKEIDEFIALPYVREALIGIGVNKEDLTVTGLSKYVFVDNNEGHDYTNIQKTAPLFLWIAPQDGTIDKAGNGPYSYTVRYQTTRTESAVGTVNNAQAYWRGVDGGTGPIITDSKVQLVKDNNGVYTGEDGGLYVDWTIAVIMPEHSSGLHNIWLADTLPSAKVTVAGEQYDTLPSLKGLKSDRLDASKIQYTGDTMTDDTQKYLQEIAGDAFTVTSEDGRAASVISQAAAMLGAPERSTDQCFKAYQGLASKLGTMHLDGYEGYSSVSPRMFSIYLGDLPATGEKGYTITVNYTTRVNSNTMPLATQDYVTGVNTVELYSKLNANNYTRLAEAESEYWLAKQKAEDSVLKNIADYDSESRIITYRVKVNPLDNLDAGYLIYTLHDTLSGYPGAKYIEDSFKLYVHAKVEQGSYGQNAYWKYDSETEQLIWAKDGKAIEENPDGESKEFTELIYKYLTTEHPLSQTDRSVLPLKFTLEKGGNDFRLAMSNVGWMSTGPDDGTKVVPMTLEYQVQLPKEPVNGSTVIDNQVTFSAQDLSDPKESALIGVSRTSFDAQNILHKSLLEPPNETNSYTAKFRIIVNKTELENKRQQDDSEAVALKEIVIKDTLSDTLSLDTTTATLEGWNGEEQWVPIQSGSSGRWSMSIDPMDNNLVTITIRDVDDEEKMPYTKYRLTYSARVVGEPDNTVHYSNTAEIEGVGVKSSSVEEEVFIKKNGGSAEITNIGITVEKVDGNDATQGLGGVEFKLYAYTKSEETEAEYRWMQESEAKNLITDESGKITLRNAENGVTLRYNTWYCLKEIETNEGYRLGKPQYFYIINSRQENPAKPDPEPTRGVNNEEWTTVAGTGLNDEGTLKILNYKPYFRVEKHDATTNDLITSGVEFTLYSDAECKNTVKVSRGSNGTFTFSDLNMGTTYYLKETKVPEGYEDPGVVYTVQISDKGEVIFKSGDTPINPVEGHTYTFQVDNKQKNAHQLPMTGGFGTQMYIFGGIALMAGALTCYIRRRRKGVM